MDTVKILLVDDEADVREVAAHFLSKRGYLVYTAETEDQAINLVNKENPDIVLLDMQLGVSTGLDVLRRIKELKQKIMVIMVTGISDEESIRQAKSLGAEDYIIKPFTASDLDDFIAEKIKKLNK